MDYDAFWQRQAREAGLNTDGMFVRQKTVYPWFADTGKVKDFIRPLLNKLPQCEEIEEYQHQDLLELRQAFPALDELDDSVLYHFWAVYCETFELCSDVDIKENTRSDFVIWTCGRLLVPAYGNIYGSDESVYCAGSLIPYWFKQNKSLEEMKELAARMIPPQYLDHPAS